MMLNRIAAAGLLLSVLACRSVQDVQPAKFIPQHKPALVWVTTTSSAVLGIAQPRIQDDTVRGMWAGSQRPVAIPLSGVQTMQARAPSPTRTAILVGTLGLVAGGTIWFIVQKNSGPAGPEYCVDPTNEDC